MPSRVLDAPFQDVIDSKLPAPFQYPLVANMRQSSGGAYVKVPMPYRSSMRVTVATPPRPWYYHVAYRHFATADGVSTFDPADHAEDVLAMFANAGTKDPKPPRPDARTHRSVHALAPGQSVTAAALSGSGTITALRLRIPQVVGPLATSDAARLAASDDVLANLRLRIDFDGRTTVDAPVGEFFGSGVGEYPVRSMMFAMDPAEGGWYSAWWPMPFRQDAKVSLVNRSGQPVTGLEAEITSVADPQWIDGLAAGGTAAYFSTVSRDGDTVPYQDWVFADLAGRGKFLGVSHTMISKVATADPYLEREWYLEGDERVHVDGSPSPAMYGTGTEDFYEGGWYFRHGPFSAPLNGNPAYEDKAFGCQHACRSAYRLMLAESVSYSSSLRFTTEHGGNNESPARYGSTAYLYARPESATSRRTDLIDVGDPVDRTTHFYRGAGAPYELTAVFEGDEDNAPVTDQVWSTTAEISFLVALDAANQGATLRRVGDQKEAGAAAAVLVDGSPVGVWSQPLGNRWQRWLEDSFPLPASATAGRTQVKVTLRPLAKAPAWTASRYAVDSVVAPWADGTSPVRVTGLRVGPGRTHALALRWDGQHGKPDVRYRVYGSTSPDVPVGPGTLLATTTQPEFRHGPLATKQAWYYRVVAVDANGRVASPSTVVSSMVVRPHRTDVNNDGRSDILAFDRDSGEVWVSTSDGTRFVGTTNGKPDGFAHGTDIPMTGDVNGDGRDDIVRFTRGDTADVFVALSTGDGFGPEAKWHEAFAPGAAIPSIGDFDGDGRDDIAAFTRGQQFTAYVALSTGTGFAGSGEDAVWYRFLGTDGAVPVTGDFDGDGRDDIALFLFETFPDPKFHGTVFVSLSNGVRFVHDFWRWNRSFGSGDDIPAVGDVNSDGRDDLLIFDRETGRVYASRSDGQLFGQSGEAALWHGDFARGIEVPGVADVDGDGAADLIKFQHGPRGQAAVSVARGSGAPTDWHDEFAVAGQWPQPHAAWPALPLP